ncbi:inter-alpha-trypsin inhibitor heavy chain H1-like isoform X1 [Canis aureus]
MPQLRQGPTEGTDGGAGSPAGIRGSGPSCSGAQACRLGGLGKGARSPREVGYHPPKCHSLPPAFKLPASQPSPTGSSADIQQLPNQVTGVDTDPHFLIHVPQKEDTLCFNINEEPGVILSLVQDPDTGFSVNGQLIGNRAGSPGQHQGTYFGRLGIVNPTTGFQLEVTPHNITLNPGSGGPVFSWKDQASLRQHEVVVTINRKRNLVVAVEDGGTFEVVLHRVWKGSAVHQDFLGFYVLDSHRMSARTHGLLGQFFHPIDYTVSDPHPGSDPTKTDATMLVKSHQLTVTRGLQKDYSKNPRHGAEVTCWFVHNNGAGLIDGVYTDYIVPDIF